MVMGEKEAGNVPERNPELVQPLQRAASGIEQELLAACLDQRARAEPVEHGRRRAGAEKGYAKWIGGDICHHSSSGHDRGARRG